MSAPRILFVDHVGVLGGGELSLLDIATHYRSQAKVVLFEDGPFRTALQDREVNVQVLPTTDAVSTVSRHGSLFDALQALPSLAKLVRRLAEEAQAYDLLYPNSQKSMIVAALAGRWAGRPVLWHLRDLLLPEHFGWLNRRVAVALANRFVTRVVANSSATRDAFAQAGGDASKVGVAHNGIDPGPFTRSGGSALSLRTELEIAPSVPLVGLFSRLATWKGQHVLIQALQDLPDVHAVLVGAPLFGPDQDYVDRLHSLTERTGTSDRIHFLGFRDDVPSLMRQVDVVAHTSVDPEPFGRVLVEAMLAGTPVVGTAAGGALEVVTDGQDGLLVPPSDVKALTTAIDRVLRNPDWARQLARRGRNTAETRFTRRAMLERVDAQISETLHLNVPPPLSEVTSPPKTSY
mgnify:CR=1 FL=1